MLRVHMYVHRRKKTSCVLTHYSTPYSFKTGSLAEPRVRSATLATLLFLSIFHSTGTSAGAWALSDFLRGCWRFSLWSSCLHTKCFHLLTYLYILSHLVVSHLTDTGEKVGPRSQVCLHLLSIWIPDVFCPFLPQPLPILYN